MFTLTRRVFGALAITACAVSAAEASPIVIESFDDGDISNYIGGPVAAATASAAHDGPFGLEFRGATWIYRDDAAVQVAQGNIISAWINFNEVADGRAYLGFGASAAGTLSFVLAPNSGDIRFQENLGYGFLDGSTSGQAFQADKWYRAEVEWQLGGGMIGRLFDSDGVTLLNSVSDSSNLFTSGGIAFRGFDNLKAFDTITVDAIDAVPEPGSLLMLGAGVLGFAVRRHRTR